MEFEENPLCALTYASFGLFGNDLVHVAVTERLGIEPTLAWNKGDPRKSYAYTKTGMWKLSTKTRLDSTNLERHIVWLIDELEPHAKEIQKLRTEQGGLYACFSCYWQHESWHGGPNFSPSTLARLAALDADLDIDFYARVTDGS